MFLHFIKQLKIRLDQPLPGEDAQYLMAPISRLKIKELSKKVFKPKKSAVLILIFPEGEEIKTVFIERPVYDGVHSGQVAFPGGKYDDTDESLEQTALREAFEEVGVNPEEVKVLGKLTDLYIQPSNFLVSPFIGYLKEKPNFIPDEREVEQIVVYNLFDLNNDDLKGEKEVKLSLGIKLKAPYYAIEGLTVWGATAMMISELNEVIRESKSITY